MREMAGPQSVRFRSPRKVGTSQLSPCSTQSVSRATMSPMTNALTNAAVAAVTASVEEDTAQKCPHRPRRTTRQEGANQPDLIIWQLPSTASHQQTISMLGEIVTSSRSICTDPRPISSCKVCNFVFISHVVDVRSLTDANEATYSIEFGSNFSL